MSFDIFSKLPLSESCRLIDFENAEVVGGIVQGTYFLVVGGTAPCQNMTVKLAPRVYPTRPEYWGIEVVGCLPGGICLPATRPYVESTPLAGITGTKGIEVIGASGSQKFDVP